MLPEEGNAGSEIREDIGVHGGKFAEWAGNACMEAERARVCTRRHVMALRVANGEGLT